MNQYDTLYKFCIFHPYFEYGKCPVLHVQPEKGTLRILANHQCIFKQIAPNEWHILGEKPGASDDWPHTRYALHFTATIHDPDFFWYTPSPVPTDIQGENICCHPGKDSLKTFDIQLNPPQTPPATTPETFPEPALHARTYILKYPETSRFWEYLLIPRTRQDEKLSLLLSDATGQIGFTDPIPTHWNELQAYRTRSTAAIPLRARYPYQLQLYEKKNIAPGGADSIRRLLHKQVSPPPPGRFIGGTTDTIQYILYF